MYVVNGIVLGVVALAIAVDFLKDIKKAVDARNTDGQSEEY